MPNIKLMNIVVDPSIQVREVESHTVSKYAQSMRAGSKFPPLLLEKTSNRIVCGNHRYSAYKKVLNPDDAVEVAFRTFKTEADLIRCAARDNARHGKPLATWDMKRIAIRLEGYGDNAKSIAELLGVPLEKIETWAGMRVVITSTGHSKRFAPIKHGLEHMAGAKVTPDDYVDHRKKDCGIPVKNLAAMISRHIEAGWIDTGDKKTMDNLRKLHVVLGKMLGK